MFVSWLFLRYSIAFLTINTFYAEGFIGEPCRYDEDCAHVENSFCEMQQICQCKHNFVATENGDTCIAMVGAYCHSRYDCSSLPNSVCKDLACACDEGFVSDPQGATCLPVATHLESDCNHKDQCIPTYGVYSDCRKSQCVCLEKYHFAGRCLFSKGLHQPCSNSSECYIGEAYKETVTCSSYYCTCKADYYESADGVCVAGSPILKTCTGLIFILASLTINVWGT